MGAGVRLRARARARGRCRFWVKTRLRVGVGVGVRVGFKDSAGVQSGQNSIAFGSAPRREAESQPISHLVRQAVSQVSQTSSRASRQADGNTQFGLSRWQTRQQAVGRAVPVRTSSGRMVMHPITDL